MALSNFKKYFNLLAGIAIGLISGFWLANSFQRPNSFPISNIAPISAASPNQADSLPEAAPATVETLSESDPAAGKLTAAEINNAVAAAAAQPRNAELQKKIGLALSQYALIEKDRALLESAVAIIERFIRSELKGKIKADDLEILKAYAEGQLILGSDGRNDRIKAAITTYINILKVNPQDANSFNYLGLAYLAEGSDEYAKAAQAFNQAITLKPDYQDALVNLINLSIIRKDLSGAAETLSKLEKINPNHPALADLRTQLAQANSSRRPN